MLAVAQPAPLNPSAEVAGHVARQAAPDSASHILAKTMTLAVADTAAAMTIFTLGSGDVIAGGILTAGLFALGVVVYPTNEYLWDQLSPNTNRQLDNEKFDVSASLWRTTKKYVTFKTGIITSKFVWVYAYTGSVAATAVMGTTVSLVLPAIFYTNSVAWDWYDWYNAGH
jgi:uncharacterized membrane protein